MRFTLYYIPCYNLIFESLISIEIYQVDGNATRRRCRGSHFGIGLHMVEVTMPRYIVSPSVHRSCI